MAQLFSDPRQRIQNAWDAVKDSIESFAPRSIRTDRQLAELASNIAAAQNTIHTVKVNGRTLIAIAAEKGDVFVVKAMVGGNYDMNSDDLQAAVNTSADICKPALRLFQDHVITQADIDQDPKLVNLKILGTPILIDAVSKGSHNKVILLLANGANPFAKDSLGNNAGIAAASAIRSERIPQSSAKLCQDLIRIASVQRKSALHEMNLNSPRSPISPSNVRSGSPRRVG